MIYETKATLLNMRSAPRIVSTNIITRLPNKTEVEKIAEHDNTWWKVKTQINNNEIIGYVSSDYLIKKTDQVVKQYKTIASALNLRKGPVIKSDNIITQIPRNTMVSLEDIHNETWWKIKTKLNNKTYTGYVHQAYLEEYNKEAEEILEVFKTTAHFLNFRKTPEIKSNNIIATLVKDSLVEKISEHDTDWWKVKATVDGKSHSGFVAHAYLEALDKTDPVHPYSFAEVHLKTSLPVTRNNERWAYPLNESNLPFRNRASINSKKDSIHQVIQYLNVEKSKRYKPKSNATYCNIYAYDYCYLNKAYLPRVWWTPTALNKILNGENISPIYAQTVLEINANSLFVWLRDMGPKFGWRQVFSLDELQEEVNKGKVGVICAPNMNPARSGHIAAVVPETSQHKCVRYANGKVRYPLQSQAGASNRNYFTGAWWLLNSFLVFGFWVHE